MLFGCDGPLVHLVALIDLGQALVVLVHHIVTAFLIDPQETVELHDLTGGAQADLFILAADLYRRALQPGAFHLTGQRALPDQIIQLALVRFGQFQRGGILGHVRGPDTFVRFLGVLGLVFIDTRGRWHVFRAKPVLDRIAGHRHRLGGHVDTVGPHISNVTGLIQTLGGAHGLARTHAEFAAGFLLQGRRHERGGRVPAGGLCLYACDRQIAAVDRLHCHFGLRAIRQIKAIQLFAGKGDKACFEFLAARGGDQRFHAPILAVAERFDFHFALYDQTQSHRLHATCRFRTGQFAPQNRRQVKADKIVQRTPRQIGFDQGHVDLARVFHRFGHSRFRNRVENNPADRRVLLDRFAGSQRLLQVPADRFPFAIGVGREDQFVVVFQRIGNCFDVLFAGRSDLPQHFKIIIGVNRSIFRGKVTHVAVGR